MANPVITDEMRESLTEEELAGMLDTELVDEGHETESEDDGEGEKTGDEADPANNDEGGNANDQKTAEELAAEQAAAAAAADNSAADAAAAAAAEAEASKQQTPERKPRPVFESPDVPADVDDQIAAAKLAKIKLAEKFDEGEITAVEYAKQTEDINEFQRDLENRKFKAQLAAESQQSREMDSWEDTCNSFLSAHPEISKSKLRYDSFDYAVRLVTGDPANAALNGTQQLEKAYQNWVTELGIPVEQSTKPESKPADQAPAKPDPTKPKVVPNIGSLPAAQTNDTDDGKFAYLDRLATTDPIKFENALAKLSEADRETYLAM